MARIFVTGSTSGLGRVAAEQLIREGHDVILHARSKNRAADIEDLSARASGVVIGDLSNADETGALRSNSTDGGAWTLSFTMRA